MASVNWKKIKSVGEAKAIQRHNERSEVDDVKHSNQQIDTSLTSLNKIVISEPEKMERYLSIVDKFNEENGKRTRRKDAVVSVNLEGTFPKGNLTEDDKIQFCRKISEFMNEKLNNNALMSFSIHRDEIHKYLNEQGEQVESEEHYHMNFVPVRKNKDGSFQMVGSDLMSRANMTELNNRLNDWSLERGFVFNTGSKKKGVSVEQLKSESNERLVGALDAQTETINQQAIEMGLLARENADLKQLLEDSDKKAENSALERENADLRAKYKQLDELASKELDKLEKQNKHLETKLLEFMEQRDKANPEFAKLHGVKVEQPKKKYDPFEAKLADVDNYGKDEGPVSYDFS